MKNWKSFALLAIVFLAGVVVGVVGTRVRTRHFMQTVQQNPERVQQMLERSLADRLWLDHDQRVQLRAILADTRSQLQTLHQTYAPQEMQIIQSADSKISALLRPGQEDRYESFKEQNWPLLRRTLSPPRRSQAP